MTCTYCHREIEPEPRYFTDTGEPRHMLCGDERRADEMKPYDSRTYNRARAEGMPARNALEWARAVKAGPVIDLDVDQPATFEREGFTIRATCEVDQWADSSWIGTFTDCYDADAILCDDWHSIAENYGAEGLAHPRDYIYGVPQTYRYFVPSITAREHRAELRKTHARHVADCLAREYVRRDYRRALELTEYIVTVTASREGIELGSASLCGIDLGDDYTEAVRYIAEVADDLADEAIGEARDSLARLAAVTA